MEETSQSSHDVGIAHQPHHPESDEIRRQVEFYFSDENLSTDAHLLSLCGGSQNLPVSIGEIMRWRKMRRFRPRKLVTLALQQSEVLEVCEDNKRVRRRIPLKPEQVTVKGYTRILSSSTKGMLAATGFEEGWCDPPTTPAEHAEDVGCYDPDLPFSSRIEAAIQRYTTKRKFHQQTARVFNSFMMFGGIDCGPRAFTGGLTAAEVQNMDAIEVMMAKATHFCGPEKDDPDLWLVDFESVAKAFLSEHFPMHIYGGSGIQEYEVVTRVMTNFYNYILLHNVCPEYTSQILAARQLCIEGWHELAAAGSLTEHLPGPFNRAFSMLLGGYYSAIYGDRSWDLTSDGQTFGEGNMRIEQARVAALTGVIAHSSDKLVDHLTSKSPEKQDWLTSFKCTHSLINETFQISGIDLPSNGVSRLYERQNTMQGAKINLTPLGKLSLRRITVSDFLDTDLPSQAQAKADVTCAISNTDNTYEVFLEKDLLRECRVGMNLLCTLRWVSIRPGPTDETGQHGFWQMDALGRVYCSFYTNLLNELEVNEKRVRWLEPKEQPKTQLGS